MDAPNYKPVYMTDETLAGMTVDATGTPKQSTWNVNPQYCLTDQSAGELLAILQAAYPQYRIEAFKMDPENFSPATPFHFNLEVPWIAITNPGGLQDGQDQVYRFNAGQFSDYWASASMAAQGQYRDPDTAWRNAQQDISVGLAYTG